MASSSKPAENKFWGGRFTGILLSITFSRRSRQASWRWEAGDFKIVHDDEDIHTANQRQLGEIIGKDIAGKLHTERSRNEQGVCDTRMWPRDEPIKLEGHLVSFLNVTATRAEEEIDYIIPGCSHL
ncbi:putative arginine-10 [Colletotrichum sublineola]|uniref:Putative arginine-10 n=1 Tax=Colletotrichum sublineola TaxID=1173701 RepID=A0A066WZE1_COLSU|nr:putative arginine-10 [Colletotrichum sublineola]